jgi:hypothetical protein
MLRMEVTNTNRSNARGEEIPPLALQFLIKERGMLGWLKQYQSHGWIRKKRRWMKYTIKLESTKRTVPIQKHLQRPRKQPQSMASSSNIEEEIKIKKRSMVRMIYWLQIINKLNRIVSYRIVSIVITMKTNKTYLYWIESTNDSSNNDDETVTC